MSKHRATGYAKVIAKEAARRNIPAEVVVAIIHHETGGTWRRKLKSRTNDYGLMQLHVSHTTHRRFLGKERKLYDPRINIYYGARFLSIVRRWHQKHCRNTHPWWAHYNWGFRVLRNRRYVRNVGRLLAKIKQRSEPVRVAHPTGGILFAKDAIATVATETSESLMVTDFGRLWPLFGRTLMTLRNGGTRDAVRSLGSCTHTRRRCGSTTPRTVRTTGRMIDVQR